MSPHKTGLRETAEIEPSWVSPLLLLARVPRFVRLLLCSIIFSFSHPRQAPVFSFQSGRLLTRSAVISLLRDIVRLVGLPFHSLKGHTFRVGAASTAAAVGLPDWLIKIMGRWSSDCYRLYIRSTSWSAAFCGPKNGQCYSVNKALFCLQGAYDGFFIFFFSCLGGYPLRVYLWRLSLRNNFPTLSFPVFSVYRPANIPVWPSSVGEIGEARVVVVLLECYLGLRVAGLGCSS